MENLISTFCNLLDGTEYCVKDELESDMQNNKTLSNYILTYCDSHECDKCWSDLGEKINRGDFE